MGTLTKRHPADKKKIKKSTEFQETSQDVLELVAFAEKSSVSFFVPGKSL